MLTGFDSKWINTLYLDKMLRYEMIIQAFSRTNRLFNESEKPHGTIRYYRRPHTMRKSIEEAISLYSGTALRLVRAQAAREPDWHESGLRRYGRSVRVIVAQAICRSCRMAPRRAASSHRCSGSSRRLLPRRRRCKGSSGTSWSMSSLWLVMWSRRPSPLGHARRITARNARELFEVISVPYDGARLSHISPALQGAFGAAAFARGEGRTSPTI